jgi:hypothetical protein
MNDEEIFEETYKFYSGCSTQDAIKKSIALTRKAEAQKLKKIKEELINRLPEHATNEQNLGGRIFHNHEIVEKIFKEAEDKE